ncbi:hypothetical protein AB0D10_07475 [Kitasatospora sp. NPDC048545]|uniref:hypothetical protein n=1 Tax=Kitasatospora sp. NPDC048545 TaxID=3157208 RepID=UPI0033DAB8CE
MPTEDHGPDPQFEQTFTEAIGRAGDAYDTDAGPLVDTGWAHGRRLRRRRRIGTAAGAAAVALVAAGGLLPGVRVPVPVGTAAAAGPAAIPGPELARMVTGLLPKGTVVVAEARGTESRAPQVRLVLDDGHGRAQLLAFVTRAPTGVRPGCVTGPLMNDPCTVSADPADNVMTSRLNPRVDGKDGTKIWISVLSADGYQVVVEEWNGEPLEPGASITRGDPPLTADQLERVVRDAGWQRVAAALPEGPGVSFWHTFPPRTTPEPDARPGAVSVAVPPVLPSGLPVPGEPAR